MTPKLVFLDIDGTLTLPGTNTPPDSAIEAVQTARRNGHRVFLCTGRNRGMLSPLLPYGFDGAVASAGGFVFIGDRILYDCPMTSLQFDTAMSLLGQTGVFRTIETRDHSYADPDLLTFLAAASARNSEAERWYRCLTEELDIRPLPEYDGSPVYKIVLMCREPGQLHPARKALGTEFNFCMEDVSGDGFVNGEMINLRFNKGKGVEKVARDLGFDLQDTIGFGDSMNDFEMLRTVGMPVAMSNGCEAVKAVSKYVCPSVQEDGIARAFEMLKLI